MQVLTVCTGNICRSPQAEQLLRTAFESLEHVSPSLTFASAGTSALVGQPMPAAAAVLSKSVGGDPDHHKARQLTQDLVDEADLVLTLAREHRAQVARLSPRASRRTFTLLEFARILDNMEAVGPDGFELPTAGDLATWVDLAASRRGYYVATNATEDDVVDPYRRSDAIYAESFAQIENAVRTISRVVNRG